MHPATLVLIDGDLASLVACAMAREQSALADGPKPSPVLGLPFPVMLDADPLRQRAIRAQAQTYAIELAVPPSLDLGAFHERGEREALELVAASYEAIRRGCTRIIWPVCAAAGDSLDLDRIAQAADRALLAGRLVGLDAVLHASPGLTIETPLVDLTDRQLADLAMDMDVPIEACWWWGGETDAIAHQQQARWMSSLAAVGWSAGA
ncbi:MAG: hypothetical protein K2Q20_14550 [Phycisphaerales bacterium]|nr:hypothetical protein [Phycisphaerales bacterium]